jgi:DNA polymerase-3 subunit epsilon
MSQITVQQREWKLPSIAIHEITPEMIEGGQTEAETMNFIAQLVNNKTVVGHHVSFDLDILSKSAKRCGVKWTSPPFIDTMELVLHIRRNEDESWRKNPESLTVQSLCKDFNIPATDTHSALSDAFLTAQLALALARVSS